MQTILLQKHLDIQYLDEIKASQGKRFGAKTGGLLVAAEMGATISPGFAISPALAEAIASSEIPVELLALLDKYVTGLLDGSSSRTLIVRSSSIHEDNVAGMFPGLFDSYLNIRSVDELVVAIAKIVRNSRSEKLAPYFRRLSIDPNLTHLGILVQRQITSAIGGIAQFSKSQIFVEFSQGEFAEALAGRKALQSFSISRNSPNISQLFGDQAACTAAHSIIDLLPQASRFVSFAHTESLTLEFCIFDGKLVVFQIKHAPLASHLHPAPVFVDPLDKRSLSNKTFAMLFFQKHKLFSKPLSILEAGWDITAIERALKGVFAHSRTTTIRFSQGSAIGLPRSFVNTVEQGLRFVRKFGRKSFDVVIHEYMDVARSFEILVSDQGILVEHVPGMWESPNKCQPDVIIANAGTTTFYRYVGSRRVVLDAKTHQSSEMLEKPISKEMASEYLHHCKRLQDILLGDSVLKARLPLNVHAVWDAVSDSFQFINIRPGFALRDSLTDLVDLFPVESPDDIEHWNGVDPVRLTFGLNRGTEQKLIDLAGKLASKNAIVAIDFGLLSHPAMVLREYGCKLIPTYLVPSCFSKNEYEISEMQMDIDKEPIARILNEAPLIENVTYHVVKDRDPITSEHFLCVAKHYSASTADTAKVEDVIALFEQINEQTPILFYERGRATFCTSEFTTAYDHFHLIRGLDVSEAVRKLNSLIDGQRYESLKEAYSNVPANAEYTVYGSFSCGFYVRTGPHRHKRALRVALGDTKSSEVAV